MLPNRFCLTRKTEEMLRREKIRIGVSPNLLARELFFKSIESGPITLPNEEFHSGQMVLEKSVWLGELETITEAALKNAYGNIDKTEAAKLWALHVENASLY